MNTKLNIMTAKKQEYVGHLHELLKDMCRGYRVSYIRTDGVWRRCNLYTTVINHFKKRYGGEAKCITRGYEPTTQLERIIQTAIGDKYVFDVVPSQSKRNYIPLKTAKLNEKGLQPYTNSDYVLAKLAIDVTEDDIKNYTLSDDAGLFFINVIDQFPLFRTAVTASLADKRLRVPVVITGYDEKHPLIQVITHMYGNSLKTHDKHDSDDMYLAKISNKSMSNTSCKILNIYRDPERIPDNIPVIVRIKLEKMESFTQSEVERLAKWFVLHCALRKRIQL